MHIALLNVSVFIVYGCFVSQYKHRVIRCHLLFSYPVDEIFQV